MKEEGHYGRWGISGGGGHEIAYLDEKRLKPFGLYCRGGNTLYDGGVFRYRTYEIFNLKDKSFVAELSETEFYHSNLSKTIRKKKLEKLNETQNRKD